MAYPNTMIEFEDTPHVALSLQDHMKRIRAMVKNNARSGAVMRRNVNKRWDAWKKLTPAQKEQLRISQLAARQAKRNVTRNVE